MSDRDRLKQTIGHSLSQSIRQSTILSVLRNRDAALPSVTIDLPSPSVESGICPSLTQTTQTYYWLFAIGSMCNPVSLSLRGIVPLISKPGKLTDHKLIFRAPAGMADFAAISTDDECDRHDFHGVLHLVKGCELSVLDRIETGYQRTIHTIHLYDQSTPKATYETQAAYVYQMIDETRPLTPPSERYIDIISRGLSFYSVDASYVEWLNKQSVVPRTPVDQLKELCIGMRVNQSRNGSVCESHEPIKMSRKELSKCDGVSDQRLCVAVNGKILLYVGDQSCNESIKEQLINDLAGRDITHLLSLMTYEPKCGIAYQLAELTELHRKIIEDSLIRNTTCIHTFDWECVGYLTEQSSPCHSNANDHSTSSTASAAQSPCHKRRKSLFSSIQANLECAFNDLQQSQLIQSSMLSLSPSLTATDTEADCDDDEL